MKALYIIKSVELADDFKCTVEHPEMTITSQIDTHKVANIECNRSILKSSAGAVLFVADSVLPCNYNTWIGNSFCRPNMHCSCDVGTLETILVIPSPLLLTVNNKYL